VLLAGAVTTIVECKPTDTAGDVLARLDIPDSRLHCYSLATPASNALDGALVLYVDIAFFVSLLFLFFSFSFLYRYQPPLGMTLGPSSSTFASAEGTTSSPSYGWSRTHRA
jgi:hypothetical protein